jgi:hypothetical protein
MSATVKNKVGAPVASKSDRSFPVVRRLQSGVRLNEHQPGPARQTVPSTRASRIGEPPVRRADAKAA